MNAILNAVQSYPSALEEVRTLVDQHREIAVEPLRLAIYYASPREPQDVFVFEVIENFGMNSVGEEAEVFEASYGVRDEFPLPDGQRLHLLLTNPVEAEVMFRDGWSAAMEVRAAVRNGEYTLVYVADGFEKFVELIRGE